MSDMGQQSKFFFQNKLYDRQSIPIVNPLGVCAVMPLFPILPDIPNWYSQRGRGVYVNFMNLMTSLNKLK
jgi:hypothetical protein